MRINFEQLRKRREYRKVWVHDVLQFYFSKYCIELTPEISESVHDGVSQTIRCVLLNKRKNIAETTFQRIYPKIVKEEKHWATKAKYFLDMDE